MKNEIIYENETGVTPFKIKKAFSVIRLVVTALLRGVLP